MVRLPTSTTSSGGIPRSAESFPRSSPRIQLLHALPPASPGLIGSAGEAFEALGEFRIVREIGRGGMGIVYEAEQVSLGRRVALKVLPVTAGLDAKQLARFRIEAQVMAALHHPQIVPIFAVGCDRGVHYYAMQLIAGRSLADRLREPGEGRGGEAGTYGRFAPARRPDSPCRRPRRWNTRTGWASCIAMSSPATCWLTAWATSGSPTSAWPASRDVATSRTVATCSGPSAT